MMYLLPNVIFYYSMKLIIILNTDNEDMYTIDGYKQITLNTIRNESGRRKFRGLAVYYHDYLQAKVKHSWQCDKYEFMSLEIKSRTSNIKVGLFYICPLAVLCDVWDPLSSPFTISRGY